MKKTKVKAKFAARLKEEFNFDVSALDPYIDEQSEEIISALVTEGKLVSRIQIMEGVKGSEKIKLLSINVPLQSADACGRTPQGDIVFTDKEMKVSAVKIDMSVCNKTLKGTWAQMLLALGVRAEKEQLPLEDVIAAYVVKKGKEKNQDLMLKGDTDSTNPDLVFYDGFIKLWLADVNVTGPAPYATAFDVENAFDRFCDLAKSIPSVLLDNAIVPEIICAREMAQLVLDNIYKDKDYSANIKVNYDGAEMSFILPTTNITVRSYPQLSPGTGDGLGENGPQIFAVPYEFMFFGTDLEGDIDEFIMFYDPKEEKIFFGAEWASGVQYVLPEYFKKITVADS